MGQLVRYSLRIWWITGLFAHIRSTFQGLNVLLLLLFLDCCLDVITFFNLSFIFLYFSQSFFFLEIFLNGFFLVDVSAPLPIPTMNYCVSDMYDMPHGGVVGYPMQGGSEYCMYPGEGPGFGHCEPQALHHPPCMEQAWPPSQHYGFPYSRGAPVFKNEYCSMEIPLGIYHNPLDYYPDGKSEYSHLQWMQGPNKRGMDWKFWLYVVSI